uniref:Ras-GAP domain-containing protein n=1 Tax=Clastoptera arizonana TaxID=38151 RepID=A0A1B6DIS6_9HEMI
MDFDLKGLELGRYSAKEMDEIRHKQVAYEYLCHLEEAKKWLEAVLREDLPPCTDLEENLRNGVYLAKLANLVVPESVPKNKIFDFDQKRYKQVGLQFRHTDNINFWIKSLEVTQLPFTFHPETTDVYDKKNMPRVIYCIHALSTHLFKQGKAPQIQDLYGKVTFSDTEINAVSEELKKYGLELPAFQKIGGVLTGNIEGDTAALHAAIMAVNEAINTDDSEELWKSLTNKSTKLLDLLPEYIEAYRTALSYAKAYKVEAAISRSLNDSYEPDVYDELLTQMEIQGHITSVNVQQKLDEVIAFVEAGDRFSLAEVLRTPCLKLKNVISDNCEKYIEEIRNMINNEMYEVEKDGVRIKEMLQKVINCGNHRAHEEYKINQAVFKVNRELEFGDISRFLIALRDPSLNLDLQLLTEFAAPLYYEEMQSDKEECQADLCHQDLIAGVRFLHQIAEVTMAVDSGNIEKTWNQMKCLGCIDGLEPSLKVQYWRALSSCRRYKGIEECACPILTYMNIQDCVAMVNSQNEENNTVIASLHELNQAIRDGNKMAMMDALNNPILKLSITSINSDVDLLFFLLQKKQNEQAEGAEIWLEDVNSVLKEVIEEVNEARKVTQWLSDVNLALQKNLNNKIPSLLESLPQYSKMMAKNYFFILKNKKRTKEKKFTNSYVTHLTKNNNVVYINLDNLKFTWLKPDDYVYGSFYLSKNEIEKLLTKLNENNERTSRLDAEKSIIGLQARCRGYIIRKQISDRLQHFRKHEKELRCIQKWWKSLLLRKKYQAKLKETGKKAGAGIENFKQIIVHYKRQEEKIIKIQALWRGRRTRKDILNFFQKSNPSFKVVRMFLPVLAFNTEDYRRELQLQELKEQVVQAIKHNNQLAQQIEKMDITIGLLIQNRITLQDVVIQGKHMEAAVKNHIESNRGTGLTALRADSLKQLKAYQHLFYALQTRPHYLAKLIINLQKPHNRANKFLDTVIFTLFHYGEHHREEYLLLKLFQHALHEEIRCKFTSPSDVMCGEPLVLKMAVYYARKQAGQNPLRNILGPLIQKVLNDRDLFIDLNPVSLYWNFRNQIETKTGKPSILPVNKSVDDALKHEEVRNKFNCNINTLKNITNLFINHILQSKDDLPYGLRFVAKELRSALVKKFPQSPEKEILKVVGNFIYYRYINTAIVAPDSFHIITLTADQALTDFQRNNLANIAKILQFAAAKKGFGEEMKHLLCLNPFLIECHEKMKSFFRSCCEVEELDAHYNMTEFSDAALITRPSITITLQEICNTHGLLQEYAQLVAPDPTDPLHELLDDLGPEPTVHQLLGYEENEVQNRNIAQTEVRIMLINKFEVPSECPTDITNLFIKTKELVLNVMPFLKGHNLPGSLRMDPTPEQEKSFEKLCTERKAFAQPLNMSTFSVSSDQEQYITLREYKAKLRKYLSKLEDAGFVSREDGYQTIITSIAKDIANKGKYRKIQAQELQAVQASKQGLDEKTKFYEEQVLFYKKYIEKCLQNLNTGKKNIHTLKKQDKTQKLKSKICLKYTAVKLKEKGVLVSIDGLPEIQYKNVMFEISPSDQDGIFCVQGKFMGVPIEKIDIDIKVLLQSQFEGVSVMDIFGNSKININLLLFLLNKKFYGKT